MARKGILSVVIMLGLLACINDGLYAQFASGDETLEKMKELSEFDHWPGKTGPVRAGLRLSQKLISALAGARDVWQNDQAMLWEIEGGQVVKRGYRWQTESGDDVYVDLTVAESCQEAHEYLIERCYYTSLPFELRILRRDQPTVAGDISFRGGRKFIRNNLVVEISAEGEMKERIMEIAKEVDALLLTRPTAPSADQMKPVIERFEIAQDPVKEGSLTRLFIKVRAPQGGELEYQWRLTGGGIKEESGAYYYHGGDQGDQKLTFIVINDSGFASSTEIEIAVQEDDFFRSSR